jgi:hypothetical protein
VKITESVISGKLPLYKLALKKNEAPSIGLKYLAKVAKLNLLASLNSFQFNYISISDISDFGTLISQLINVSRHLLRTSAEQLKVTRKCVMKLILHNLRCEIFIVLLMKVQLFFHMTDYSEELVP